MAKRGRKSTAEKQFGLIFIIIVIGLPIYLGVILIDFFINLLNDKQTLLNIFYAVLIAVSVYFLIKLPNLVKKIKKYATEFGNCKYCNQSISFFKRQHEECNQKHIDGRKSVQEVIAQAFKNNDASSVKQTVESICQDSYIDDIDKNEIVLTSWENAVSTALEDNLLTDKEEQSLREILGIYAFSSDELENNKSYRRLRESSVLKTIMNGKIPELNLDGNLPFNFLKNEKLVYILQNVKYYEKKNRIEYVGRSSGVSVRIAKGVYYRTGAFKGSRVESEEVSYKDTGLLAITTKHIYFGGGRKSFRVKFDKIVSFNPYMDGVGIQKEGVSAKPQLFIMEDGWFAYNLLLNASKLE